MIARTLKLSRRAVVKVMRSGRSAVPAPERDELAAPMHDRIRELHAKCVGRLGRVREELCAAGAKQSHQALTGNCRRRGFVS